MSALAVCRRWILPILLTLITMMTYQFVFRDWLDDWAFLHVARMEAIRQSLQQRPPTPRHP